jgi:adenylyltransferase/sulfurtransferase
VTGKVTGARALDQIGRPYNDQVPLSDAERRRYSRHLLLPGFGEAAQAKLKAARVLIVGAGGLGSPASLYLAAAGVGGIGLVDFDTVDETNLQRQILYGTADVGRPKLDAAVSRLRDVNPLVEIERIDEPFGVANARALVATFDVVVDGTDNFPTRYLVNDACVMAGTPNVYGSVSRFEGQASVFAAPGGPCYRCLHPEPPPAGLISNCADGGVLGVLPGLIGTIQATEAIKLITGIGEPLIGRLVLYDALTMRMRQIGLPRDPDCPVCSDRATIRELIAYEPVCETFTGSEGELTVDELRAWRREGREHALVDVREPSEHAVSRIEGAMLMPLASVGKSLDRLPRDRPVVVYCRSGARSARAVGVLRSAGFDAHNLAGGILAWER